MSGERGQGLKGRDKMQEAKRTLETGIFDLSGLREKGGVRG